MLKAFSYCKDMDCGKVVASTRDEAIEILERFSAREWPVDPGHVFHDETSVDFVYADTHFEKGVYPIPYADY